MLSWHRRYERKSASLSHRISAVAGRWRVLGIACLAHVLHDGYSDMLYLLFPFWQRELALSLTEIGVLKTLFSGAMAIFQVPSGRLGERWGERPLLVGGTLLAGGAVFALNWSDGAVSLGLLLVVAGIGSSVQHPLSSTLVSRAYGGPRLRAMLGTYNFAGDMGKVLVPALLTLLIALLGWRTGTEILGVLGVVVAVVLMRILAFRPAAGPEDKPVAAAHSSRLPESLRRRGFLLLSAIGILDGATRSGLLTFLPFVLSGKGAGPAELGAALTLIFIGGAAGKFGCGLLATRVGLLRTVVLTELATAVAIPILLVAPLALCFVLMPAIGFALNGTSSVLYGTVPELAPGGRQARAFGLFYTVAIGAGAVSPTFYGMAGDGLGLTWAMLLVAGVVLLVLPLVGFLRPILKAGEIG